MGPEFSSQLIMLKESFRKVIICRHEPGYFFRDLLADGCISFPTARGRCASPSALVYQATQRRPPISSSDHERVEWPAQGLVLCSASDSPGVATQRLPRPLAWAEWWGLPWSPIDPAGAAAPHSMHVAGQSDLGLASYCGRTSIARI